MLSYNGATPLEPLAMKWKANCQEWIIYFWVVGLWYPADLQTLQAFAFALIYPPGLDGKTTYRRKSLFGDYGLRELEFMTIIAGNRHGAGAVAESSHIGLQIGSRERHTGNDSVEPQSSEWHSSSNKATSPNPSQTVPSIRDQVSKAMSLWEHSHSNHHRHHIPK